MSRYRLRTSPGRLLRGTPAGLIDALALVPPLRPAAARWHEYCGRVRRAAACVRRGSFPRAAASYGERLIELERLLDAGGFPPDAPAPPAIRAASSGPVLMALHSAAPWVENGYDIRTRCLRAALAGHGVATAAVTRPNFPHDLDADQRQAEPDVRPPGCDVRLLQAPEMLWDSPLGAYIDAFAQGLVGVAREGGARAIHAMSNHVVGLAAIRAARRLGVPAIYEIRGLWHRSTVSRWPGWDTSEKFALHEALERDAARRADHVVVLSRALADHVRGWGVAEDRVIVVPNGVDTGRFHPRPAAAAIRAALGAGPGSVLIGYAGTLTPYEGQDRVVRAAAALRARGCDARLAFIGGGEAAQALRRLAEESRVPTVMPGRIPHEAVADHLAAFDICAFPRRDDPACRLVPPVKLAEAMACGVPVVVSDLAPLTEHVVHDTTGLVTPAVDDAQPLAAAFTRLIREPGLRERLGAAGRAAVEARLRWSDVTRPYLPLYGTARAPVVA